MWAIEDLGSNNGTYVNGQRIQSAVLADNDEIVIADTHIRLALPVVVPTRTTGDFDAVVTVLDLKNPSIVVSSETASATGTARREASGVHDLREHRLLERRMDALCAVLDITSQATEPRQVLDSLCAALLDVFPVADSVGVLVEDEQTGELKAASHKVRHLNPSATIPDLRVPKTIIQHVMLDRRGILVQDRPPVPRAMATGDEEPQGSRMGAPIQAYGTHYGVIYVESAAFALRQEDVDLLTSVAGQAGQAIHATRMQHEVQLRQRLERDLRVARQIQRSLLPPGPPDVIGLDFAAHYDPAYEIGGDFYDFIWHDKQHLAFVVGDVAGKAISAALYMARLTSELRSRASLARTPGRLLKRVNEELLQLGDDSMFATLVYAVYDLNTRMLAFTNAGHVVPLLRRDGRVYPLQSDESSVAPLGVVPQLEIGEARVQLHSGDLLVLTTDGIHEARDASGNEYGIKRLSRRIRTARGSAQDVVKAILQDVDAHVGTADQGDDMTIVAVGVGTTRARARTETLPGVEPLPSIDPKAGGNSDESGPIPTLPR